MTNTEIDFETTAYLAAQEAAMAIAEAGVILPAADEDDDTYDLELYGDDSWELNLDGDEFGPIGSRYVRV